MLGVSIQKACLITIPCRCSWPTRTVDQSATMMEKHTDAKFGKIWLFCSSLAF